jgi:F0F1-type ATP synthase membrane subunit b/b'
MRAKAFNMEMWQIILICILLLPTFYLANYLVVKKMVKNRREREDRIERAVAASVAKSFASNSPEKYKSWPKYKTQRKR